jgi:hypothetical protein
MPQFVKRIPMNAHAALKLGERLGGATLEINASGHMIMSFEPRISYEPWGVRILEVDLAFEPFKLPLPSEKYVTVDGMRVTNADFDMPKCRGTFNRESGEVTLHLEIVLDPERIPQLRALDVREPLRVQVDEVGTMDFVLGRIIQTHAKAFQIPSNLPEGLLEARAGQSSCEAIGHLLVAVAGPDANQDQLQRFQPTTAWVCPGSQIILAWKIDNYSKVKSARITGGGMAPIAVTQDHGSTNPIPAPNSDTTYTLEVTDTSDCKSTSTVNVFVVTSGRHIDIQALQSGGAVWSTQLPAIQYDPKILGTSIRSELCFGELTAFAFWALRKTDPDGSLHAVNIRPVPDPLGKFPLAGFYDFTPIDVGTLITAPNYDPNKDTGPSPREANTACFDATLSCG